MTATYKNGAIIIDGALYENVQYNISNEQFSFILDGKGSVVDYSLADARIWLDSVLILHYDEKWLVRILKRLSLCRVDGKWFP